MPTVVLSPETGYDKDLLARSDGLLPTNERILGRLASSIH